MNIIKSTLLSPGKTHYLNLVASPDSGKPYEVEFRHNASGDIHGGMGDALVAFRLDKLPDTKGRTVKLKLKWKSFSGEKSVEFDYNSGGNSTPVKSTVIFEKGQISVE